MLGICRKPGGQLCWESIKAQGNKNKGPAHGPHPRKGEQPRYARISCTAGFVRHRGGGRGTFSITLQKSIAIFSSSSWEVKVGPVDDAGDAALLELCSVTGVIGGESLLLSEMTMTLSRCSSAGKFLSSIAPDASSISIPPLPIHLTAETHDMPGPTNVRARHPSHA